MSDRWNIGPAAAVGLLAGAFCVWWTALMFGVPVTGNQVLVGALAATGIMLGGALLAASLAWLRNRLSQAGVNAHRTLN